MGVQPRIIVRARAPQAQGRLPSSPDRERGNPVSENGFRNRGMGSPERFRSPDRHQQQPPPPPPRGLRSAPERPAAPQRVVGPLGRPQTHPVFPLGLHGGAGAGAKTSKGGPVYPVRILTRPLVRVKSPPRFGAGPLSPRGDDARIPAIHPPAAGILRHVDGVSVRPAGAVAFADGGDEWDWEGPRGANGAPGEVRVSAAPAADETVPEPLIPPAGCFSEEASVTIRIRPRLEPLGGEPVLKREWGARRRPAAETLVFTLDAGAGPEDAAADVPAAPRFYYSPDLLEISEADPRPLLLLQYDMWRRRPEAAWLGLAEVLLPEVPEAEMLRRPAPDLCDSPRCALCAIGVPDDAAQQSVDNAPEPEPLQQRGLLRSISLDPGKGSELLTPCGVCRDGGGGKGGGCTML